MFLKYSKLLRKHVFSNTTFWSLCKMKTKSESTWLHNIRQVFETEQIEQRTQKDRKLDF